jgi:hypothetical protein
MADAVEKSKNELILFFICAPVETGISQSNVSQRAYESCRLEIGLIMCPLHHFRTAAQTPLKKLFGPPKDFFNSIGPNAKCRHVRFSAALGV